MNREKMNNFLMELTKLCNEHKLYFSGLADIVDGDDIVIGTNVDWDYECQSYTATFDDHGSRF